MFILYDSNHVKICALTDYKDYHIEQAINVDDVLQFSYPVDGMNYSKLAFECYIRTDLNEYVIKEINVQGSESGVEWVQVVCKVNLEDLKGHVISNFETVAQLSEDSANLALAGTGWIVGHCDEFKLRTVRKAQCSVYDVLTEITTAYKCEIIYNAVAKTVTIHQKQGAERGSYFAEQLNLKTLNIQGNTNGFITRLIPIGRDGLGITSVNAGYEYVSNYQYSTKILTGYWVDNRYTDAQALMEDAIARLDFLSKPYKAYSANIIDLANVSDEWEILDFALGDLITLLSESYNVREYQRIIKVSRYPEEPEKSKVEIANKTSSLVDIILKVSNAADVVNKSTDTTGAVVGSSVAGELTYAHIDMANVDSLSATLATVGTLIATKIDVTQLDAVNADIDNLQADKANVTDLTASTARIDTLETNSATIAQLNATNASITNIQIGTAQIVDGSILSADIGNAQIKTANIADLQVGTAKIALLAVTSAQISDLAVSTAKIGDAQITNAKIGTASITSAKIGDAQITNAKIDRASVNKLVVNTADIANLAVGQAQIANAAIGSAQIENLAVSAAKIAVGCITSALIENGAIGTVQIANGSITDAKIVELTASKITAGTIDCGEITVINLNAANITVGTINGNQISAGAIDTVNLAQNAVHSGNIAVGAITEVQLANGIITNDKLALGAIAANKLNLSNHMLY